MRSSEKGVIVCSCVLAYCLWMLIGGLPRDVTTRRTYAISGYILLGVFTLLLLIFRWALHTGDKRCPTNRQIEIEEVRHKRLSRELDILATTTKKAEQAQASLPPAFVAIKAQKAKELDECQTSLQQLRKLEKQEEIVREAERLVDKMQPRNQLLLRPSEVPSSQLLQPTDAPD